MIIEMSNEKTFTPDFLIALSNWQGGWADQDRRRTFADELVKHCENLPIKFKAVDHYCYRKRFIVEGEMIPIFLNDNYFDGIASWTEEKKIADDFKGFLKVDTKFAMIFKHKPLPEEVIVNINSLWQDKNFKEAAQMFINDNILDSKYLKGFKNSQQEVILRSTLKGSEVEDIVAMSRTFEEYSDIIGIPKAEREGASIRYTQNPNGLPIEIPFLIGSRLSKSAVKKAKKKFAEISNNENTLVDLSKAAKPNSNDLRHKL
jgi:hypothetical protein